MALNKHVSIQSSGGGDIISRSNKLQEATNCDMYCMFAYAEE